MRGAGRSDGPALGVVADDLTGACDLAAWTTEAGLAAVVHVGAAPDEAEGAACSVVALKSRTAEPEAARSASAAAARRLRELGAARIYQKHCSTFDSTARGNIGPVADALAAVVGTAERPATAVGTPATPAAGRTQHLGHLFVGDRLLAESSMRDHPLTPMRDSDLVRVLAAQTPRPVALLPSGVVRRGAAAVAAELARLEADGVAHVLVDAQEDEDLDVLAAAVADRTDRLLTGAAGFATALARRLGAPGGARTLPAVPVRGRLVLSGSASARTMAQVAAFDGLVVRVDPLVLAQNGSAELVAAVGRALDAAGTAPVLVSATAAPERVRAAQEALGVDRSAELVEQALAAVALDAVSRRASHLLVAGGETSGAVATALGVRRLEIGRSAAPGVPWTVATGERLPAPLALLLKSGNFGGTDLFRTAWRTAP